MSAEVLDLVEKLRQDIDAALGDLSSELESLRRRVEAIEDRHKRVDESLLALKREWDAKPPG
jgi:chaperonin cofactor prefoldin